jgi:hypothetical protein
MEMHIQTIMLFVYAYTKYRLLIYEVYAYIRMKRQSDR